MLLSLIIFQKLSRIILLIIAMTRDFKQIIGQKNPKTTWNIPNYLLKRTHI